ncbi:MAG: polysaccharide biosynthesis C-terminal domain-containing protein, partial [Lachnospiraceae bacterium]|nr:polysaccharide biosynthesis C-terminal domain-containing protein [Lachnospiraceae bacterium]
FNPILHILKAEGELNVYFTQYYRIMLFTYPLMVVGTIAGMFIRVDGKPQFCMLISIIGCILNVILDAVFVGAFSMGVQGSAVASFIVQLFTVIVSLSYFFSKNAGIHFCYFQFDRKIHQEIVFNGSSEFIGEMASAISMFAFNYVLMRYVGTEGVAAFTILGFAVYVYSMICIGFGQGITPLVSMCWGAQEKETAMDLRIITNNILFVIGLLFAVIFFFFGKMYAGIFGCSSQVVDMVASGFKVYVTTFVIMGYDVINSMYFTSCGDAKSSALISALRGVVLLLAFTLILPAFLGMTGVWLAAPCTEALTAIVSLLLITKQKKNVSMMVLNS